MDVLISWSGRQSRTVAEGLYVWLPKVIPTLRPWMSTQDIDKGSRWYGELQKYLGRAKGCIVCLTSENISSPWVYWETGAIGLTQEHPICPLLTGLSPDEIKAGPLSQYQCAFDRKDDVFHLVRSLNQRLDTPEDVLRLKGLFETNWRELEIIFEAVATMGIPSDVRTLLTQINEARTLFARRWGADKAAQSTDPIRHLVAEISGAIEKAHGRFATEKRIQLHLIELRDAIRAVTSSSNRTNWHERGDAIGESFEKAIRAIRADFDRPDHI